ncbi:MAG: DEAD/DEAH box helicase [Candidatus Dadabacteria bacterium]|nr:MAG: DEAD/DEAH box helicase [Candidatus Dadabacteria bacterium]
MSTSFFEQLGLAESVMAGIRDAGFIEPTPIQRETLPITIAGKSVTGQAQTGSGKTAAFLIATLHRLLEKPRPENSRPQDPRALIIAPTRELIKQISDNAAQLGAHTVLKFHTVIGGVDYKEQKEAFRDGVDVLIGTPGRLIDYYKQKVYSLDKTEILVIDECDRMFDLGFIADVRWLIRRMPPAGERQNLLFSATVDYRVEELAWEYMDNPPVIAVDDVNTPPDRIRQVVYHLADDEKYPLLIGLIRKWQQQESQLRVIVFTNRRHTALRVSQVLEANGIRSLALSGALDQKQRFRALDAFKETNPPVIVATDVASRGLHIDNVSHVVNWDIPDNPKDYIHRVGRTARAGAEGEALILATQDTVENLPKVEETLGRSIDVAWAEADDLASDLVFPPRPPRKDRKGGVRPGGGRRGGGNRSQGRRRRASGGRKS